MRDKLFLLLTGATGFVGKNFKDSLPNDIYEPVLLSRIQLQNISASDIDARINTIIHFAGKAHDVRGGADIKEYYDVNFELTKRLYDAFLASNAQKFVFISSVKAAADRVSGILTEEVVSQPQTAYGKSKLMAEKYIQNQFLDLGKQYYILRPCMIHGPGNKGNLNLLFNLIKRGLPYPLAAFENKRSFLGIENFCYILKELINRADVPSGIYNISDDVPLATRDVVDIMVTSLGRGNLQYKIDKRVIYWLARMGDILNLSFSTEQLNKLVSNYEISNEKIKSALNISLPVSSRDGLIKTIKSFCND